LEAASVLCPECIFLKAETHSSNESKKQHLTLSFYSFGIQAVVEKRSCNCRSEIRNTWFTSIIEALKEDQQRLEIRNFACRTAVNWVNRNF
jgi:hypothetical protein